SPAPLRTRRSSSSSPPAASSRSRWTASACSPRRHSADTRHRAKSSASSRNPPRADVKIAISTGGGDAPGLNAVIRGAVLAAVHRGWACVCIRKGYDGFLGQEQLVTLGPAEVRSITHLDG